MVSQCSLHIEVPKNFKCKEIFISNTATSAGTSNAVQVFAELTNIPAGRMYSLDGVVGVTN